MVRIVSVPGDYTTLQDAVNSIGPNQSISIILRSDHKEARVQVNDGRDVTIAGNDPSRTKWSGDDRGVWGLLEIRSYGTVTLRSIKMTTGGQNRAVWSDYGRLVMENSEISDCERESVAFLGGFGGAMECRHSNVTLKNSVFLRNSIKDNAACVDCFGGALYFNNSCIVNIDQCVIEKNGVYGSGIAGRWALGGGIWCEDSEMTVRDTRIMSNIAQSDVARGGGVALKNVRKVEFIRTEITGNQASGRNAGTHGQNAGLFLERGLMERVTLTDSLVADNTTEDGNDPFAIRR